MEIVGKKIGLVDDSFRHYPYSAVLGEVPSFFEWDRLSPFAHGIVVFTNENILSESRESIPRSSRIAWLQESKGILGHLYKNVEYPADESLEDVWSIINAGAINTTLLDFKINSSNQTIALIKKLPTIKGLFSQSIPIKKLRSKTILLNDGSTFTNAGSDPAYWKQGPPSYPNGWYAVTDPRTTDQGGTGYVGYVNPKIGPNGEAVTSVTRWLYYY